MAKRYSGSQGRYQREKGFRSLRIQVYKLDKDGKYSFPKSYKEENKIKVGIFNNYL